MDAMMKYSSEELDNVYQALANSARRKILTRLCTESCTISELAEPFDMSLAAVSKHIKILERAGLVVKHKEGTIHRCEVDLAPIESASALIHYLEQFMGNRSSLKDAA